jgi:hypothetical protein
MSPALANVCFSQIRQESEADVSMLYKLGMTSSQSYHQHRSTPTITSYCSLTRLHRISLLKMIRMGSNSDLECLPKIKCDSDISPRGTKNIMHGLRTYFLTCLCRSLFGDIVAAPQLRICKRPIIHIKVNGNLRYIEMQLPKEDACGECWS